MSETDHYSHYLAIYDSEKSQRDSSRNLLLTGQVGVATAALVFYQSSPGLLALFALLSFLMAHHWLEASSDHSQRLAFILWVIMRYEIDGTLVKSAMTSLYSLRKLKDKGVYYDGENLRQDPMYVKLLKTYRNGDWIIFGAICFMWFCMIELSMTGRDLSIFGRLIMHNIGIGG